MEKDQETKAAEWLAHNRDAVRGTGAMELMEMFQLDSIEVCCAIARADQIRKERGQQ